MRDIYKAIGLHPSAPDEKIRERIGLSPFNRKPEAQLAAEILLSRGRRNQYDRVHNTLQMLSFLRASTGTSQSGYGRFPIYDDFRRPDIQARQSAPTAKRGTHPAVVIFLFLMAMATYYYVGIGVDQFTSGTSQAQNKPVPDSAQAQSVAALPAGVPKAQSAPTETTTRTRMPPLVRPGENVDDRQAIAPPDTKTPRLRLVEERAEPLPATGGFYSGRRTDYSILVKTDPDGDHTFVKIEGVISGRQAAVGFIRAGDRYTFHLPKGTYLLKTASGETWYGRESLFGPETRYSKADDTFPLNEPGEQWTVELIRQTDGNLTESALDEDEF